MPGVNRTCKISQNKGLSKFCCCWRLQRTHDGQRGLHRTQT